MWNSIQYLGGAFLGWSLGANDSANVFGTAVSSRMVSYRTAIVLTALFVIIGALLQGQAGIRTLSEDLRKKSTVVSKEFSPETAKKIRNKALQVAVVASVAAAFTVTIMTILKIPVSTSQAVVGAIIGIGIMQNDVNAGGLGKVIACWIGTPVGGIIFTLVFYWIFKKIFNWLNLSVFTYDPVMSLLLIICGCYGAYALGANNVANVSAVFVGKSSEGMLSVEQAALFGAISIAVGVLTYSKPVMLTVGKGIIKLDSFCAFICVLSHAVTVHIYAMVGVPVSTSQAIVGAILGIGFIKGAHTVDYRKLVAVSSGWLATPFVAGIFSAAGYFIVNLKYAP
jgi:PiT family inorganic phosphate transporter